MLSTNASTLHQQLKSATEAIHNALHHQPLLRRLLEPDCTLEDYRSTLTAFHQFYCQAEVRFSGMRHPRFSGEAPALAWLSQDLSVIGPDLTLSGLRTKTSQSADFSNYLGYLYVKQGSTLGGQVLSRRLSRSLGLSSERGLRFFSGFGEQTQPNWLYFLCYLNAQEAEIDIALTIASAREHFQALEIIFNQALKNRPPISAL